MGDKIPPYLDTIKNLELLRDEQIAVKEENYELAAEIRDQIIKLNKKYDKDAEE